jgi:hypothetical protein
MKFTNLHKVFLLAVVSTIGFYLIACGKSETPSGKAKTPTEAYEQLFAAVKSKNTENIKKVISKSTLQFAEGVSGQTKKPVKEILMNGFHRSTMTDKLPAIRDERVKDKFGSVEVWIQQDNKWEDVNFVMEDGGWKLAVGETWGGVFKSPGKSLSIRERENANAAGRTDLVPYSNSNVNMNVKPIIIDPAQANKSKE